MLLALYECSFFPLGKGNDKMLDFKGKGLYLCQHHILHKV